MWFAKWFGGRKKDDSEPSEHPPHPLARATAASIRSRRPSREIVQKQRVASEKGFDPYNSGTFDRNKAWERVRR